MVVPVPLVKSRWVYFSWIVPSPTPFRTTFLLDNLPMGSFLPDSLLGRTFFCTIFLRTISLRTTSLQTISLQTISL